MIFEKSVSFEEFMRRALHDREHGYYSKRIKNIGHRGNFTTTPMVSEMPARAIAAWAANALSETRCLDLIEIGPGVGKLTAAVRRYLPWHLRWRVRMHMVETSDSLTVIQKKLLGNKVFWHREMASALAASYGKAVIFSNELVDAFPVRRFQKSPDGWRELAVSIEVAGKVSEHLMPEAPLPDSSGFSENHASGQWIEVHDSYRRWLLDWLPLWKSGRLLTIDYGALAETLYHRQPLGTVRGYLLQQKIRGSDIYQNIGYQDLTADVNFTDLIDWSAPWTCDVQLCDLSTFLKSYTKANARVDHELIDTQGAGGAFLVLDQKCDFS